MSSLVVEATALTDRGCERKSNEDSAVFVQPGDAGTLRAKGVLALVADGMGGHRAGEVASVLAAETVRRVYYSSSAAPAAALAEAFAEANRAIYERANGEDELHGMGTTCTALAIRQDRGYLAHVGDSRLYLLRGGDIYQMTEDHSFVAELVRLRVLTPDEAHERDDRNVITRALGTEPAVTVAGWPRPLPLRAGDRILLATDGLHDLLERASIQDLSTAADVHSAGERLVAEAKQRGGFDNISIVLIALLDPGEKRVESLAETRKMQVTS